MDKLKSGILQVFSANILSLMLGLVTGFLMPRSLSVETYATIKTYQLYISYIGFVHLGFADGVYLKYGGENYSKINQTEAKISRDTLFFFQFALMVIFFAVGILIRDTSLIFFAISIIPLNILNFYKNIYQATGEFAKYKNVMNLNTVLTLVMVVLLTVVIHCDNYIPFFIGYTIINFIVWMSVEHSSHLGGINIRLFHLSELIDEVKSGFSLLLGNFASILLTSMDRWFIKVLMTTINFAEYSFAVSMENLLNVAVTPVTTTMYNYFCETKNKKEVSTARRYLTIFSAFIVICAFPVKLVTDMFINKYVGALHVLFILFAAQIMLVPIKGIYVNLYKAEKKQNRYFFTIVLVLCIGFVLNVLFYSFMHNKESFAVATLLSTFLWYLICILDFKHLGIPVKELIYTLIIVAAFYGCGLISNCILGGILYLTAFLILSLVFFKHELQGLVINVMNIIGRK